MPLTLNQSIPESLLNTKILDKEGQEVSFKNILNGECCLVVMVRHFGCFGCTTQMLEIAPRLKELQNLEVNVKIIGNGQVNYIEGFIDRFNLQNTEVEIYTDPSLKIYEEAQMVRSFWKWMNPRTVFQFIKALSKGISQKSVQGDNIQFGGTMLVGPDGNLEFYFQNQSVTGIADTGEIMKYVHKHVVRVNPDLI